VKRNCQKAAYQILVKFTLKDGDQSVAQMMVCFCHESEKQNWGIIGKSLMWMIKIQYVYFSLIE
jgi:hypothetical protein